MPARSVLLDEYREVGNNLRFYGDMRFKQLGLITPVEGGLIGTISQIAELKIPFAVIGLVLAFAFLIMEIRSTGYWKRYFKRAMEIEEQVQMAQYTRVSEYRYKPRFGFSATRVAHGIYVLLILLWIYVLGWF